MGVIMRYLVGFLMGVVVTTCFSFNQFQEVKKNASIMSYWIGCRDMSYRKEDTCKILTDEYRAFVFGDENVSNEE